MSPCAFRLTTLGVVVAFLALTHAVIPGAEERAWCQYRFVIALGYGHLIGAAVGARRPERASPLGFAFAGLSFASGFALYLEGVAAWPGLAFALLALSVWHFTENDVALARALAAGTAPGPLARHAREQSGPIAAAAAVVGAALAVSRDAGLLGDLFSAATLFHLVGWLVFLVARGASRTRLLALHAPPLLLCAWLSSVPTGPLAALREWAFSPAIYLFWASLHVVHTAFARRGAPARA